MSHQDEIQLEKCLIGSNYWRSSFYKELIFSDSYLTPLIETTSALIDVRQDTLGFREAENRYDLKLKTKSVQLHRGNDKNLTVTVSRPSLLVMTLIKNSLNPKIKTLAFGGTRPLYCSLYAYTTLKMWMPIGLRRKLKKKNRRYNQMVLKVKVQWKGILWKLVLPYPSPKYLVSLSEEINILDFLWILPKVFLHILAKIHTYLMQRVAYYIHCFLSCLST